MSTQPEGIHFIEREGPQCQPSMGDGWPPPRSLQISQSKWLERGQPKNTGSCRKTTVRPPTHASACRPPSGAPSTAEGTSGRLIIHHSLDGGPLGAP
eukprot:scaffold23224_cov31-Tisochrysis_lutea.AAC.3